MKAIFNITYSIRDTEMIFLVLPPNEPLSSPHWPQATNHSRSCALQNLIPFSTFSFQTNIDFVIHLPVWGEGHHLVISIAVFSIKQRHMANVSLIASCCRTLVLSPEFSSANYCQVHLISSISCQPMAGILIPIGLIFCWGNTGFLFYTNTQSHSVMVS